jgi:CheY-like chemotaxis protein
MKNKTALIVEDNEVNLALTRDILLELGMKTIEAGSAEDGIRMARETAPDIIIMDYKLPAMNGFEATRVLKDDSATKHIPIMILTASAFTKDRKKAFEAGCDAFLIKPINIDEFIGTMKDLFI